MLCRECGYHVNLLLDHIIYHARQLVRRRHHYLDHAAGEKLPEPASRHVQLDLHNGPSSLGGGGGGGGGVVIGPASLPRVREGTPDSEASAASHAELLHG